MARKKRPPEKGPSNAYLMSFGDTMTTLLAFFIVLNSLAEEQTGANLHAGTGSFIRAISGMGLTGLMDKNNSMRSAEFEEKNPQYVIESDDEEAGLKNPLGPDEEDNRIRSIDAELETLQRFFKEMDRYFDVTTMADTDAEIAFDLFDALNDQEPYLKKKHREVFAHVLPMLRRENHRAFLIVWATTPKDTAVLRAVTQANKIANEITTLARLNPAEQQRIIPIGKPWLFSDVKRPVYSIVVQRMGE